jgi:RHS repeat-associated protein
VLTGDEIAVSVQSWYANNGDNTSLTEIEDIVSAMLSGLLTQGAGVVDETTLINYAGAGGTGASPLSNFLDPLVDTADMSLPQGFLIYVFFDEFLNINSQHSGMIQVGEPGALEMLQSQAISIPSNGYFYTYLTNYSDNLVSFDNLTIRRKNGVVRSVKEYYPYGLEYGRFNGSFAYNAVDMYNKGYTSATWHELEWKYEGLDLNYFAARYYDPIIGRWHAPDPLEQCHSPYAGMVNDPAQQFLTAAKRRFRNASPDVIGANYIDPDGRSAWMFLCGSAANGAGAYATAMNVTSTFRGTFGALGGVASFVSSGASVFAGLRGISTIIDFVNQSLGFAQKHGNYSHIASGIYANATTSSLSTPADGGKDIEMTDGGIWIQANMTKGADGSALKVQYKMLEIKDASGVITGYSSTLVYQDGSAYKKGSSAYIDQVFEDLELLRNMNDIIITTRMVQLSEANFSHVIKWKANTEKGRPYVTNWEGHLKDPANHIETGSWVNYHPEYDTALDGVSKINPAVYLAHELLGHSYDFNFGTHDGHIKHEGVKVSEINAVNIENVARSYLGINKRLKYFGVKIDTDMLWDTH